VVVTFVYSTCEDTCPSQVQTIRGALDDLGEDVPVLAISVDPENDTPRRAKRFLAEQRMTGRASFVLGTRRPPGMTTPDLGLPDQDGRLVRMRELRGSPVVVTFVYATCDDTCPAQVQSIRGALDDLGRDVPVVAISVDPENDTPTRAKRFLAEQRMTGRARFVLGTRRDLAPVWRAYGIQPQRGALDHTAFAVLVDKEGTQRIGWPYSVLTVEGLTADLRRLLAE
ncbi:MAG TPA: SCO family protein, partial [Solirubrobacteraceae bacterium]|nr:SCO family protein [Solirubrobacteraceae bacterium]